MSKALTREQIEALPAECAGCDCVAIVGPGVQLILDNDAALRAQVHALEQERDVAYVNANMLAGRMVEQGDQLATYCARNADLLAALKVLVREASGVANDHHRPRYTRLDEAVVSAQHAITQAEEQP